jgi:hypothetical protein
LYSTFSVLIISPYFTFPCGSVVAAPGSSFPPSSAWWVSLMRWRVLP